MVLRESGWIRRRDYLLLTRLICRLRIQTYKRGELLVANPFREMEWEELTVSSCMVLGITTSCMECSARIEPVSSFEQLRTRLHTILHIHEQDSESYYRIGRNSWPGISFLACTVACTRVQDTLAWHAMHASRI